MKRVTVMLIALVGLMAVTLMPCAAEGTGGWLLQRIQFAPGAISAVRYGALPPYGTDQWVAKIMGGQTLTVQLTSNYSTATFRVRGADGAVLADGRTNWSGTVPATQDYYITVQASVYGAPSYALTVTIPPLPVPVPVPQRRAFDGTFDGNEYIVELSQAYGCMAAECPVTGRLIHITAGAPEIANIQGTGNTVTGAIQFHTDLAGGQRLSGTLDAPSRTLSGTLSGYGPIRLVRR